MSCKIEKNLKLKKKGVHMIIWMSLKNTKIKNNTRNGMFRNIHEIIKCKIEVLLRVIVCRLMGLAWIPNIICFFKLGGKILIFHQYFGYIGIGDFIPLIYWYGGPNISKTYIYHLLYIISNPRALHP